MREAASTRSKTRRIESPGTMRRSQEDTTMDKPRIMNLNELPAPREHGHGEKFAARIVPLGADAAARLASRRRTQELLAAQTRL